MSDSVASNSLQHAAASKAYAPIGVKFWESQEIALQGLQEFAEGSFARRHKTAQAALKAAKQMVDAARASDVPREAQSWLTADGTVRVGWQGL